MASVITLAFEGWKAQEAATGKPVLLNEFVFANIPNLDPTKPIDRNEKLPPANQIVHRQAVNKAGLVSENAVAYSVTLGADVGDFDFNWIGLLNKESGTIAMITHAPIQKKLKTQNGQQGNVLIRSFLLEFNGAAEETQIKTSAETWQIDFTARLMGIDEMQRLINVDNYGAAAFFNDGFEVTSSGEQFTVKKGLGYVGGLRGQLEQNQILNGLRNTKIYADFSYQGNIVSKWNTVIKITSAATLSNYVDAAGFTHQVFAIASIDASGNVKDLRPMGALSSQEISALETRFKLDLSKKIDKANITNQTGNSSELVASQQMVTTELAKKQPVGNYQPAGNYATKDDLISGLSSKFETNDVIHTTGSSTTKVMSQDATTKALATKFDKSGGGIAGRVDVDSVITASQVVARTTESSTLQLNPSDTGPRIEHRVKNSTWFIHGLQNATGTIMHLEDPGTVPVGGYILWASNSPFPSHFWEAKDRAFSATEYPELAKIHPSLRIPDPRGYGIRIADNGRGIDTGRTVGTFQEDAIQNIEGVMDASASYGIATDGNPTGPFYKTTERKNPYAGGGSGTAYNIGFSVKRVARTADETRMKNYSMILLIRVK